MIGTPAPLRFGGELEKRIKHQRIADARQLKRQEAAKKGKPKSSRQAQIAAYKEARRIEDREALGKYQAGLERYIANPACFEPLMQTVLFEDGKGAFTALDLLKTTYRSSRKSTVANYVGKGLITVMMPIAPVLIYLGESLFKGHTNIYKPLGMDAVGFSQQFGTTLQPKVLQLIKTFDQQGLLELRADDENILRIKRLTPLGKKFVDLDNASFKSH